MKQNDARQDHTSGLAFFAKSELLSREDVARALKRMAHEIVEKNQNLDEVVLIALQRGGKVFGESLQEILTGITGRPIELGLLDVSFYRDDLEKRPVPASAETTIPVSLEDKTVILVDDVLFTGRTIRAALNALSDWGRPHVVQLAVMVDRGHRELPIRPDFIGKNLPTSMDEAIVATVEGVWIGSMVAQ
ncbi:MAG: bifunctional pyr operon transcriptional regulator/uracil phosphoribosyltransferase PyrR [Actinomycetota bacterium]